MADVLVGKPFYSVDDECSIMSSNMHIDGQDYQIKYKVSRGPVSHTANAFLAAGLFPAMKVGSDLRIEGAVSPKLLSSTNTIQDIIKAWFQGYTSISIKTEISNRLEANDQRGLGAF